MAGKRGSWIWISLAILVAAIALGWPLIEEQLIALGGACPWPFNMLHRGNVPVGGHAVAPEPQDKDAVRKYTLEELKKYDGSDPELPILLAIRGKIVDVSSGAKFYGPGKMYSQFAGTACTRALTLSSLDKKDITDDVSDFTADQLREMEETAQFYYDKYPVVGELANN